MKKITLTSVVLTTFLMTGCATQSFVMNGNYRDMARNDEFFSENIVDEHLDSSRTVQHHFFISGIAQGKAINASRVCGGSNRVLKVETETTLINGLLGFFTFGIYAPREARVYCAR